MFKESHLQSFLKAQFRRNFPFRILVYSNFLETLFSMMLVRELIKTLDR